MAIIHVRYSDDRYDYMSGTTVQKKIAAGEIRQIFRPSEKKWITIENGFDPRRQPAEFPEQDRRDK